MGRFAILALCLMMCLASWSSVLTMGEDLEQNVELSQGLIEEHLLGQVHDTGTDVLDEEPVPKEVPVRPDHHSLARTRSCGALALPGRGGGPLVGEGATPGPRGLDRPGEDHLPLRQPGPGGTVGSAAQMSSSSVSGRV